MPRASTTSVSSEAAAWHAWGTPKGHTKNAYPSFKTGVCSTKDFSILMERYGLMLFVDGFSRSRPETAETQSLRDPRSHHTILKKHKDLRTSMVSHADSNAPRPGSLPNYLMMRLTWRCACLDVVKTITMTIGTKLGSLPTKLPLTKL